MIAHDLGVLRSLRPTYFRYTYVAGLKVIKINYHKFIDEFGILGSCNVARTSCFYSRNFNTLLILEFKCDNSLNLLLFIYWFRQLKRTGSCGNLHIYILNICDSIWNFRMFLSSRSFN